MTPKNWLWKLAFKYYLNRNSGVVHYNNLDTDKVFNLIKRIYNEVDFLLYPNEAYNLYKLVKYVDSVPGDISEVGCYQGGSTKIICESKGDKTLHVFDTFSGLSTPDIKSQKYYEQGEFNADLKDFRDYIKEYNYINIVPGDFRKNSRYYSNYKYSFVHLDVDLYDVTLYCLEFYWDLMSDGGIILIHDYPGLECVRDAVSRFCRLHKNAKVLELSERQGMIVK